MCTALFYYTCVYIYSLLNFCGYWTLNKYYYYYFVHSDDITILAPSHSSFQSMLTI